LQPPLGQLAARLEASRADLSPMQEDSPQEQVRSAVGAYQYSVMRMLVQRPRQLRVIAESW
jgi:hypothetical protein